ncbi:MAG: cytochrome b [Beijerinckiaceae bacterium]
MSVQMTTAGTQAASRQRGPTLAPVLPWAKVLHWTTAVCVLFLFVFGLLMTQLGGGVVADWLYSAHKSLGLLVIALLVLRLAYRGANAVSGRWRGRPGNRLVHWLIYSLTLMVGLLGWAGVSDFGARTVFFGVQLPSIWPEGAGHSAWFFPAHVWLAFLLMALILVHIGIAVNDYVTRHQDQA